MAHSPNKALCWHPFGHLSGAKEVGFIPKIEDFTTAIGIDPSLTNMGYVVLSRWTGDDRGISLEDHGVFKSVYGPDESVGRLWDMGDFVRELIEGHEYVDAIAVEGYSRGSMARREEAGELGGVLRILSKYFSGLGMLGSLYVVAPKSLKKFACGKGNAGKVEVALGLARKWPDLMPPDMVTEHEADALALAMAAMLKGLYNQGSVDWNGVEGVLAYEGKILDGLEPVKL